MNIEIINYSKNIKKKVILDCINISMNGGCIYGLQGINGSGKTMLMRAICGLIHPTEGRVLVDSLEIGKDISFPPSIGFLIETPSFLNYLSGIENLKMLASIRNIIGIEEIEKTMSEMGLESKMNLRYKKYSLGMKQRLGICAAIMENPNIVILDEPFNALDSEGIVLAKKAIIAQKERGALVIVACHNIQDLVELCDEIFYLENGKII